MNIRDMTEEERKKQLQADMDELLTHGPYAYLKQDVATDYQDPTDPYNDYNAAPSEQTFQKMAQVGDDLKNAIAGGGMGGVTNALDSAGFYLNSLGNYTRGIGKAYNAAIGSDLGMNTVGNVADNAGTWFYDTAGNAEKTSAEYQAKVSDPNNLVYQTLSGSASSIPMMLSSAALSLPLGGMPAMATLMGSSEAAGTAGGLYRRLRAQGMSDQEAKDAANRLFWSEAPLDIASENIFGMFGKLAPKVAPRVAEGMGKIIPSGLLRSVLGEGLQEGAQETYQEWLQNAAEKSAGKGLLEYGRSLLEEGKNIPEYMKTQGLPGALSGMFMAGFGGAVNSIRQNRTQTPQEKQTVANVEKVRQAVIGGQQGAPVFTAPMPGKVGSGFAGVNMGEGFSAPATSTQTLPGSLTPQNLSDVFRPGDMPTVVQPTVQPIPGAVPETGTKTPGGQPVENVTAANTAKVGAAIAQNPIVQQPVDQGQINGQNPADVGQIIGQNQAPVSPQPDPELAPQGANQQIVRVPDDYQPQIRESGYELPDFSKTEISDVEADGKAQLTKMITEGDIDAFDGLTIRFPKFKTEKELVKYVDDVFGHISKGKNNSSGKTNVNRVRSLWLVKNTLQHPMAIFDETGKGTHSYMSIYKDGRDMMHQLVVKVRQDGSGAVITSIIVKAEKGHDRKNKAVSKFFSKLRSLKDGELLYLEGVKQGGLTGYSGLPAVPASTGNISLGQPGNSTITQQPSAGNPVKIITPDGNTEIDAHYAVMPADSLTASNTSDLTVNPNFPAQFQPRDRSNAESMNQINNITKRLDPARLTESRLTSEGAPIVDAGGIVESGNGRTLALMRGYRANAPTMQVYRQHLIDNAAKFGLDPTQVANTPNPVLVRVRDTPMSDAQRIAFATGSNQSSIAGMSATETARIDAGRLTSDILKTYNPELHPEAVGQREFHKAFLATIPQNEHNTLIKDGKVTQALLQRESNALVYAATGDDQLAARMTESPDDNVKNISRAIVQAAPTLARMNAEMQAGHLRGEYSLAKDLADAANWLSELRANGQKVADHLNQLNAFSDFDHSEETKLLLSFFDQNKHSSKVWIIRNALLNYARSVEALGGPNEQSLFEDVTPPSKFDLLRSALDKAMGGEGTQGMLFDGKDMMYIGQKGARNIDSASGLRYEDKASRMYNNWIAEQMEREGKDPRTILLATGWQRLKDGHWRYELTDGTFTPVPGNKAVTKGLFALGDIYDDKQLYDAYPAIKDTPVLFKNLGPNIGAYVATATATGQKIIVVNTSRLDLKNRVLTERGKKSVLHEVQHLVQVQEGFAQGGNEDSARGPFQKQYKAQIDEINAWRRKNLPVEINLEWYSALGELGEAKIRQAYYHSRNDAARLEYYKNAAEHARERLEKVYARMDEKTAQEARAMEEKASHALGLNNTDYFKYWSLGGENEARNTANRLGMTGEERRQSLADDTADIRDADTITVDAAQPAAPLPAPQRTEQAKTQKKPADDGFALRSQTTQGALFGGDGWVFNREQQDRDLSVQKNAPQDAERTTITPTLNMTPEQKFGQLEKLRNSEPIKITGTEIEQGETIKDTLRNAFDYGLSLRWERGEDGKQHKRVYVNADTGQNIEISRTSIGEVLHHDRDDLPHIQAIAAIPQIIEKSIYVGSELNNDLKKHPQIKQYDYYVAGLVINGTPYTVKMDVALDNNGHRYYDHGLTRIEKGELLSNISLIHSSQGFDKNSPIYNYDKRLLDILQVKNASPARSTIELTGPALQERGAGWGGDTWTKNETKATTDNGAESSGGYNITTDGKDYYIDPRNGRRTEITPDNYTERYVQSRVKRIGESMQVLKNSVDVPIRKGVVGAKMGVRGYLDSQRNSIHVKAYNDIRTATHEIGHAYDVKMKLREQIADMVSMYQPDGEIRQRGQAIYDELCELGKETSPRNIVQAFERNDGSLEWEKARDHLMKEGVAEAFALSAVNRSLFEKAHPAYAKFFNEQVEANPQYKASIEEAWDAIAAYEAQPEFKKLQNEIGKLDTKLNNVHSFRDALSAAGKWVRWAFDDKGVYLKDISDTLLDYAVKNNLTQLYTTDKKGNHYLRDDVNVYALWRAMAGTSGKADEHIGRFVETMQKAVGKEDFDLFSTYLVAQHAEDYFNSGMNPGLPGLESIDDVQARLNDIRREYASRGIDGDAKLKEFARVYDELMKEDGVFYNAVAKPLIEQGVWTKKTYNEWRKKYPHYVPFYRDMTAVDEDFIGRLFDPTAQAKGDGRGTGKITNVSDPLSRKKTGVDGVLPVKNPIVSMLLNIQLAQQIAAKNETIGALVKAAQSAPQFFSWLAEPLSGRGEQEAEFKVAHWENGKKKMYAVDKDTYKAFQAISTSLGATKAAKLARIVTNIFTGGTTRWNLGFIVPNVLKDSQGAAMNSDRWGAIPIWNSMKGILTQIAKENGHDAKHYLEAIEAGVIGGHMTEINGGITGDKESAMKRFTRRAFKQSTAMERTFGTAFRAIGNFNEMLELGPKVEEFVRLRERGVPMKQAAIMAREVNIDFSRGGAIAKAAGAYIPFFNAGIQGSSKSIRAMYSHPAMFLTKAMLFAVLPQMLLRLAHDDDDEYKNIDRDIRNKNFVFRVGDHFWKLPIAEGVGRHIAAGTMAVFDKLAGSDPDAFKGLAHAIAEDYAPGIFPAFLKPIAELGFNKDFYTWSDIVPRRLQDLPPALQFDERTSTPAKVLGQALNISPVKIDHYVRSALGPVGNFGIRSYDTAKNFFKDKDAPGGTPYRELRNQDLFSRFSVNEEKQNNTRRRFYDYYDEVKKDLAMYDYRAQNGEKVDREQYEKLRRLNAAFKKSYQHIHGRGGSWAQLNLRRKAIEQSKTLTGEQKRQKIQQIDRNVTKVMQRAVDEYYRLMK